MDNITNALNWFEIYVDDLDRAKAFYENVFGIKLETMDMGEMKMYAFPYAPMSGKVSGALIYDKMRRPSLHGAMIYFNSNPDLSEPLSRVEGAGGKVTLPKTKISEEIGYMAFFTDTEGNGLAMHSRS